MMAEKGQAIAFLCGSMDRCYDARCDAMDDERYEMPCMMRWYKLQRCSAEHAYQSIFYVEGIKVNFF